MSLLYALDVQVRALSAEGVEARWARHAAMQAATESWVASLAASVDPAFGMLAPAGARSPTVSCITLPTTLTSGAIVDGVAARGYVIGSGYGPLKENTIRIGHMGDHDVAGVTRVLAIVREVVEALLAR